jgi:hypothetical protein
VRLISDALADQPAARKAGLLRTDELTLIKRSPMPSLILVRYEVRRNQIAKLGGHSQCLCANKRRCGIDGHADDERLLAHATRSRKTTYSSF